jgi:hypothetical protein
MKIAVGARPYDGPWGGGNRFVAALCEALTERGDAVVHDLKDGDIDIILLMDPRTRSPNVSFGAGAILRYLQTRNAGAIVVHRVNECDERKGEPFINHLLARANYVADATVFIAAWLAELPVWRNNLREPWYVVRNGADERIFNADRFKPWNGQEPLKLVTHHWGYHPMKGFDIYTQIDRMIGDSRWSGRLEFTYVGQLPRDFKFVSARYIAPLDGRQLADELASHHVYVSGSINEPAGMHHIEGAMAGLPLLYRESGALPEYCRGFGISFAGPADFEAALTKLMVDYPDLVARMPGYPWTAARMIHDWIAVFDRLLAQRGDLIERRRLWRQPLRALATQLPL